MKNEISTNVQENITGAEDIGIIEKHHKSALEASDNYEELKELHSKYEKAVGDLEEAEKCKRRWIKADIVMLILLLIILLFSLLVTVIKMRQPITYYSAEVTAKMLKLDKSYLSTMTTEELLDTSKSGKYVSNCMEFYYDPIDDATFDFAEGNTTYYSITDLNAMIVGQELGYQLTRLEENDEAWDSMTSIATKEFSYGFKDGSCQAVEQNTTSHIFDGYTKTLVDNYMEGLKVKEASEDSAVIVINKEVDVTEDFINRMLSGVLEDYYMGNYADVDSKDITDVSPSFYGLYSDGSGIYYLKSHGMGYAKEEHKVDVTQSIAENISNYLGEEVTVTTQVPLLTKEPLTVIYLSSCNYAYDNFYLANEFGLY